MKEPVISYIQRFSVGDGPGIRSTVFFKGCNLHCPWCHNPETVKKEPELLVTRARCKGCGACLQVCSCHTFEKGIHQFQRERCTACSACVAACATGALSISGKRIPVDDLLEELLEDESFYKASGGGVTLSGGEPLLQPEACAAVAQALHRQGISVLLDTAGCVPFEAFETVLPYLSMCYFDVKSATAQGYRHIGGNLALVMENLKRLTATGLPTVARIPVIPGFNQEQLPDLATLLKDSGVMRVDLLPFHRLASGKYQALDKPYAYEQQHPLSPKDITPCLSHFTQAGLSAAIGG